MGVGAEQCVWTGPSPSTLAFVMAVCTVLSGILGLGIHVDARLKGEEGMPELSVGRKRKARTYIGAFLIGMIATPILFLVGVDAAAEGLCEDRAVFKALVLVVLSGGLV